MSLTAIRNPNLHTAYNALIAALSEVYEAGEAKAIADRLVAHQLGLQPHQRILERERELTTEELTAWQNAQERLLTGEPIQYITGSETFRGLEFAVDSRVLIPRPETEELVQHALDWLRSERIERPRVLEFGTGSGCISISLAAEYPTAQVLATDISEAALAVARNNLAAVATQTRQPELEQRVKFCTHDLFTTDPPAAGPFDLILSNPPYIPAAESQTLHANVTKHEPHIALFVEDQDAMAPYRQLAHHAKALLANGGRVMVELHAPLAQAVADTFLAHGLKDARLVTDQFGRKRFALATQS